MRNDGRSSTQARPLRFTPDFTKHADGSVLVEVGDTRVLCTATVDEGVPNWMRAQRNQRGWVTAEYSMLPGATHSRTRRERGHVGGRTQEIQRLIGRSLRGVVDLTKIPDLTITVDCDVLQADGGTRCASITGAYVALRLAVARLQRAERIRGNPLTESLAAISVGLKDGELLVDVNYEEDRNVDADINIVMTGGGRLLELQGTAEGASFSQEEVVSAIGAASAALEEVFPLQSMAAEGKTVES